jgi:hypothetical protein
MKYSSTETTSPEKKISEISLPTTPRLRVAKDINRMFFHTFISIFLSLSILTFIAHESESFSLSTYMESLNTFTDEVIDHSESLVS